MFEGDIRAEPVTSSGALSCFYAAVDELDRRYGDMGDSPDVRLDELSEPRGVFMVARDDGHPVGGVGARPIGNPSDGFAEVKRLWVRADRRRDGVATALMNALESWAREVGYRRLYLETGPRQPEAIRFYRREGWRDIERFASASDDAETVLRFMKDL